MSNISDGLNGRDGDDDGRARLIKGTKLKFVDEWIAGDDVIAADREFIVVEIIKASQKWDGARPIETLVFEATEKFPDIEKLNSEAPREEWREKFGKTVGPWELLRGLSGRSRNLAGFHIRHQHCGRLPGHSRAARSDRHGAAYAGGRCLSACSPQQRSYEHPVWRARASQLQHCELRVTRHGTGSADSG
jgi:hypothetical protein